MNTVIKFSYFDKNYENNDPINWILKKERYTCIRAACNILDEKTLKLINEILIEEKDIEIVAFDFCIEVDKLEEIFEIAKKKLYREFNYKFHHAYYILTC